jgi:integrase
MILRVICPYRSLGCHILPFINGFSSPSIPAGLVISLLYATYVLPANTRGEALKVKLTKRAVESIKAASVDVIVWDTDLKGFGLKITPLGRRSYFLYYRTRSGQQRRPNIGLHGALTCDEARQIARKWLAEVATGTDVSAERQANRRSATIADLAARYLVEYAQPHKKARSVVTDQANIENHILPLIGRVRIGDLRRVDIEHMMLAIRDGKTARRMEARRRGRRIIRGGEGIANRVLALVSKMLACALAWELVESNVARGIRKFRETRKDRFLDSEEIGCLINALDIADNCNSESPFATAAIRLLLWTGMRSSEVIQLRWREVDLGTNCLRIADTKTGARIIPLSSHTLGIINSLPRGSGDDFVFQSSQKNRPLALTRPWYRVRAAAGIDKSATIHTLRHTFASWSVMDGQSLAQVGAILGHKSTQTTLRYADHRIEALRGYSQKTGDIFMRTKAERR